jgi:integrase
MRDDTQPQLVPSLAETEETVEQIREQVIPTERPDQEHFRAYLLMLQQEALKQAAQAADVAARRQVFEQYREEKRAQTVRRQRADLLCFQRYLDEAGVPMSAICEQLGVSLFTDPSLWQHITFGLVLGFRKWAIWEKGYTTETVNARLQTIRYYARLSSRAGFLPSEQLIHILSVPRISGATAEQLDEARPIRRVGGKKAEPTFLGPEHLQRLFATRPQTEQGWRDLVALRLLYDMVLRPGEAVTRATGDVDLNAGTLAVYRRKTRKRQWLTLSRGTLVALHNYLPRLEQKYKQLWGEHYSRLPLLVPTDRDGEFTDGYAPPEQPKWPLCGISTQSLYRLVRKLGNEIGIPNLCPYDARHEFARGAVKAGNDRVSASKYAGWSADSKMLERYYGHEEVVPAVKLLWE